MNVPASALRRGFDSMRLSIQSNWSREPRFCFSKVSCPKVASSPHHANGPTSALIFNYTALKGTVILRQFLSPDGDDCVDEATRAEANKDGMETSFSETENETVLREITWFVPNFRTMRSPDQQHHWLFPPTRIKRLTPPEFNPHGLQNFQPLPTVAVSDFQRSSNSSAC